MRLRAPFHGLILAALLVALSDGSWADSADKKSTLRGDAKMGRDLFNGKGVCHYCHGVDGFLNRRPSLTPDTKSMIDRLSPPPANLRSPDDLHLKEDQARFNIIRDGHLGTGMFPDHTLTDQEIKNMLAYLSLLRRHTPMPGERAY